MAATSPPSRWFEAHEFPIPACEGGLEAAPDSIRALVRAAALFFLASTLVAACSNPAGWFSPGLGLNKLMPVPQPFKASVKTIPPAASTHAANDISLAGIAGLAPEERSALAAALTRASDRYDILVQARPTERQTALLKGRATFTPKPAGREILLALDLHQPDGALAGQFEIRHTDPESEGALDPETIAGLAADIAAKLAAARGLAPVVASHHPQRLFIAQIRGAPGDGDKALAAAIAATLTGDGIEVTSDRRLATYSLAADIALTDNGATTQSVSITWRILDTSGASLAEVAQSNTLPKGALDRAWGDTAYDVATAAAAGLVSALEQLALNPSRPERGRGK